MKEQETIGAEEASMIDPEVVVRIRALRELGWGSKRIAAETGVSRKAVKRYLGGAVAGVQVRPRARRLDAVGEARARELFSTVAEGNAVVVKDVLQAEGARVSERTVQRVVAPIRQAQRAAERATPRFETAPGEQMQIDFGEKRVSIAGVEVVVHLMAAVLGYSRRIFVRAFLCERAEDWREGIATAFRHFGGVTRTLLVDNTRCLVQGREVETRSVRFHSGLVELCKDFGCLPRACAPYRARTKGKIESGVKFVKRNALAGRSFASFAALEAHLSSWMARVDEREHGTTHEAPSERFKREQPSLRPLPSAAIRVRQRRLNRRVANDSLVDVDTIRYSVPHRLVRSRVEVDVGEERVRIFDGTTLVADHQRSFEPHSTVVDPAHHAGLWRPTSRDTSSRLEELGRSLNDYADVIGLARPPGLPPREVRGTEDGPADLREAMFETTGGAA